jgi:uncharacterized membrane protein YiaA
MKRKRNTVEFLFLAWTSLILSLAFVIVGIWNTEWELVEKGYYAGTFLWSLFSAVVLSKVIRDNQEDKDEEISIKEVNNTVKPVKQNQD